MNSDWIMIAGFLSVLGFLWNLHRDMAIVRERLAKLEGIVELLAKQFIDRQTP